MAVDAHFHVWDQAIRDHSWLSLRPELGTFYPIEQYEKLAASNGIGAAVLVQVLNDLDETAEFLAIAAAHPVVAGVVGWIDLESPDIADVLAGLREGQGGEHLVAVRHLVEYESDPGYLDRPAVLDGLRAVADCGLVFDLLVTENQLEAALRAVRAVENLSVVLDHAGKPVIAGGPSERWVALIGELAATTRVDCKVSGLVTEAGPGWTRDAIRPFVDRLLGTFGPGRLVFGSDWPVCAAVASYEEVLGLATSWVSHLSPAEQAGVLGTNARRVYGLGPG